MPQLFVLFKRSGKQKISKEKIYNTYTDLKTLLINDFIFQKLLKNFKEILENTQMGEFFSNFSISDDYSLGFIVELGWFYKTIKKSFTDSNIVIEKISELILSLNEGNFNDSYIMSFFVKNRKKLINQLFQDNNDYKESTLFENKILKSNEKIDSKDITQNIFLVKNKESILAYVYYFTNIVIPKMFLNRMINNSHKKIIVKYQYIEKFSSPFKGNYNNGILTIKIIKNNGTILFENIIAILYDVTKLFLSNSHLT